MGIFHKLVPCVCILCTSVFLGISPPPLSSLRARVAFFAVNAVFTRNGGGKFFQAARIAEFLGFGVHRLQRPNGVTFLRP